jgi:protein CWC15
VLKTRQQGQGSTQETVAVNFKQQLAIGEQDYRRKRSLPEPTLSEPTPFEEDRDESLSDSDGSSSSDDEAELMRELERVKREREEGKEKQRAEEERQRAEIRSEELLRSTASAPGYALQKKWTEETVFRNQCHGEPKPKARFINDTVRSDFHKKFLSRYVQ